VDGGPRRVFDVRPPRRLQQTRLDEVVERRLEMFKRLALVVVVSLTCHGVLGDGERGVEEAWLRAGEVEVCPTHGANPASRPCWRVRAGADSAHPVGHSPSELPDRLVADRCEKRVAVGEMAVGGVRNDPDHPRYLAQHDRVRPARPRELDAGLYEGGPDGAARPRPPAARRIAGLRVMHVTEL
jgi:hypothetical protein